jgi:hypothetical protein
MNGAKDNPTLARTFEIDRLCTIGNFGAILNFHK